VSAPALGWYVRRLSRMSPAEVAWRTQDQARRVAWSRRRVRPPAPAGSVPGTRSGAVLPAARQASLPGALPPPAPLPPGTVEQVPPSARQALLAAADELLAGRWETLGVQRTDLVDPDWFRDPVTGVRSDPDRYAFRLDHRSPTEVGDVKQVWELSRHTHLTVLAAAYACSGDERYAERVAAQLRSWWDANPFLSGVHWTSGIEVGLRLVAWAWVRRLLTGWAGAAELFEQDPLAQRQVRWHTEYLTAFRSRGSSANNHIVAEAAGLLVGACAFGWFPDSDRHRTEAGLLLERELARNTFPSGLNRELASEYHGFVALLGLLAAVEADAAGHPLSDRTWRRLVDAADAAAALVDATGRPPRQGDGDDGRALLLDAPPAEGWATLLAVVGQVAGPMPWWPAPEPGVTSTLVAAMVPPSRREAMPRSRPARRPDHLPDAGTTLLRTTPDAPGPELWCRCDGGPHGFLSIAGHAHADALSLEVRHDGVDVLADPGTYCYHGQPGWRAYFRSTLGHNTLQVAGRDQSTSGGPFLWLRHARTQVLRAETEDHRGTVRWAAEHDGYAAGDPPVRHRRDVELDRVARRLTVRDRLDAGPGAGEPRPVDVALPWHLGPQVEVALQRQEDGVRARLDWTGRHGPVHALLELPAGLDWTAHRGETDPVLGWYSPRLGEKVPSTTLVGRGALRPGDRLVTVLGLDAGRPDGRPDDTGPGDPGPDGPAGYQGPPR